MNVKQIDHLLNLLELFAEQKLPMTLTRISEVMGLPKSSTHNLIETLSARGYLYEVKSRGGVYPSRKLLMTAEKIALGDPITALINEFLKKLAFETGETALLTVRTKDKAVYLAVVQSSQPIRYSAEVGDRRPIYATSGGKAILSTYPINVRERELATIKFSDLRETTIQDADTLENNIREGEKNGFFLNLSEYTPDVTGVGIPLIVEGRTLGLSIAGPNYRMQEKHEQLASCLKKTAVEIAKAMEEVGLGPNTYLSRV